MSLARSLLLCVFLGIAVAALSARTAAAQMSPDYPTGGTSTQQGSAPERSTPRLASTASLVTAVSQFRSGLYLYRLIAPAIRHPSGTTAPAIAVRRSLAGQSPR